jgi:hypothetical protein
VKSLSDKIKRMKKESSNLYVLAKIMVCRINQFLKNLDVKGSTQFEMRILMWVSLFGHNCAMH